MGRVRSVNSLYVQFSASIERGEALDPQLLDDVAADLVRRRTAVESFAPTAAFVPNVVRWILYAVMVLSCLGFSWLTWMIGFRFGALLSFATALLLTVNGVRSDRLYRACRTSILGRCVGCGYDLKGLEDAVEPDRLRGTSIGPAICPECATQWPKVPREGDWGVSDSAGRRR